MEVGIAATPIWLRSSETSVADRSNLLPRDQGFPGTDIDILQVRSQVPLSALGVDHHVGPVSAEPWRENAAGVGHSPPQGCIDRRSGRRRQVDSPV